MKLAAIAKLIKADGYCKLYKVFYDDCRTYAEGYGGLEKWESKLN